MTILEAVERAKRMAREKESAAETARLSASGKPGSVTAATATAAQRVAPVQPVARREPIERVDFNVQTCDESRLLVPGGDQALARSGEASYRVLRTRILHRARANGWKAIGFTSPGPGEGKSVTVSNIALSAAREMNSNVFLVDLDLRNPSVPRYFGVKPPVDLVDFMSGNCPVEKALFSVGINNLLVAGSGAGNSASSELVAAGRHLELFDYARSISSQPLILVDLPPVLSTDEALVVAPQLDAIFMVIGEGVTRRDGLGRAVELLAEFNFAGIILNRSKGIGQDYYSGEYNAA
jgi:Mrp family chromosome partitioning ATPase